MSFLNGLGINYLKWDGRIPPATLGGRSYPDVRYKDSLHRGKTKFTHDTRLRNGGETLPYRNNLVTKAIPMWNKANLVPGVNKFSYDYYSGHAEIIMPIEGFTLADADIPTTIDSDLSSLTLSFWKAFDGVAYNNVIIPKEPNVFTVIGEFDQTHTSTIEGTGIRYVSEGDVYISFFIRFQVTPDNKIIIRLDIDSPNGADMTVLAEQNITFTFTFDKTVTANLPQLTLNFKPSIKELINPPATLLVSKPIEKYHIFYLNEAVTFGEGSGGEAALRKIVEDHYLFDNYAVSNRNHMYSYRMLVVAYNDPVTGLVGWFDVTTGWFPPADIVTTVVVSEPMLALDALRGIFPIISRPVTNDNYEIVGEITIIENYNTNGGDNKTYSSSMMFDLFPSYMKDRLTVNIASLNVELQRLGYYSASFLLPDHVTSEWVNNSPVYNNNFCDFRYLATPGVTHDTINRPVVVPADMGLLGLDLYLDHYALGASSIRAIDVSIDGVYGAVAEQYAIPDGSMDSSEYICQMFGNESRLFILPRQGLLWLSVSESDYPDFITYDSAITIQVKYTYASGATAITDFTVMTVDSALFNVGAMPEDWLTFIVPML